MRKTKMPVPTESAEQQALFEWAKLQSGKYPQLLLLFHIPNGGMRDKVTAAILKAEGVKSGVPDVFLPYPCGGYHGLFVEMKRQRGGQVSEDQKKWLAKLENAGYCCEVCRGFEEAKDTILAYLAEGRTIVHGDA